MGLVDTLTVSVVPILLHSLATNEIGIKNPPIFKSFLHFFLASMQCINFFWPACPMLET